MLTKGEEYTDRGQDDFENAIGNASRITRQLAHRSKQFGMQLIPGPQST